MQVNESPIYWAISIIDSNIMKQLVDIWEVDVNSMDRVSGILKFCSSSTNKFLKWGRTVLHGAIFHDKMSLLKFLAEEHSAWPHGQNKVYQMLDYSSYSSRFEYYFL